MNEIRHISDMRPSAIYALKTNGLCVKVYHIHDDVVVGKHIDGSLEQFRFSDFQKADSEQVQTWVQETRDRREAESQD